MRGFGDLSPKITLRTLTLLLPLLLAACAGQRAADPHLVRDPWEGFNRGVFSFNQGIDKAILKPVAKGYVAAVPEFGRNRIHNVLANMREPLVFVNSILQLRLDTAAKSLSRFLLNTTVGLAGLFDIALDAGVPPQFADFGQTLYVWGFDSGPYLMLPFFGPSNPRDTVGLIADSYIDPFGQFLVGVAGTYADIGRSAASGIDARALNLDLLDQLEAEALDFYAQLRSVSWQRRQGDLRAAARESLWGLAPKEEESSGFDDPEDEAPPPAKTTP